MTLDTSDMEILFITFIAGLICFIMPRRIAVLAGITAFLSSALCLYFSISAFAGRQPFLPMPPALVDLSQRYELFKIDALNGFLVPFICLFGFLIVSYSIVYIAKRVAALNQYYAYLLWTICSSCAAVSANNIILFLLMWGIGAFLLYLLIIIQDPAASGPAAKKTFVMIGGSDAIMLLGAAILWHSTGSLSIDKMHLAISTKASAVAFLALCIGALTKAGAMPFHTWIPDSSEVAPLPVVALLPASLDKLLGIYLLARCTLNIFTIPQNSFFSMLLMVLGAGTIICAVMMALMQHNFKKLLAYHAVSQVGYMILGIGSATPIGIAGGLFHMLNNAVYKSCLFLAGGNAEHKTGQSELDKLGGLAVFMPFTFISALIASLSISGVPPFNGFFSKWMIYQGLIDGLANPKGHFTIFLCLMAAMFGSALTLASFMKFIHAIFLGQMSPDIEKERPAEVSWFMRLPVLALSLLCVLFGVFAYQLPLKYFIYPAIEAVPAAGNYAPLVSTAMIILGILSGLAIYFSGGIIKSARKDSCFIGGETIPLGHKVSGAEFYNTIKEVEIIKNIYGAQQKGVFDIYQQGKKFVFSISGVFQYLHNGVLPTYLVWCLLGMLGLFFIFIK